MLRQPRPPSTTTVSPSRVILSGRRGLALVTKTATSRRASGTIVTLATAWRISTDGAAWTAPAASNAMAPTPIAIVPPIALLPWGPAYERRLDPGGSGHSLIRVHEWPPSTTAVHIDLLAIDVGVGGRDQESDHRRHVLGGADPAEGGASVEFVDVGDAGGGAAQALAHLGHRQARGDNVGADAVGALLLGERQGQGLHGRLAHVVGRAVGRVEQGGDAGDHDDVAAPALAHVRDDELAEVVWAERVHPHHPLHFQRVGVDDALAAAGDAGVVDQDVDVAEVGQHQLHHAHVVVPGLHRAGVGDRLAAEGLDGGHRLVGGVGVAAVVDGDVGAGLGQRQGHGAADAPAAAGDQGHAALERYVHEVPL